MDRNVINGIFVIICVAIVGAGLSLLGLTVNMVLSGMILTAVVGLAIMVVKNENP